MGNKVTEKGKGMALRLEFLDSLSAERLRSHWVRNLVWFTTGHTEQDLIYIVAS